jgi:hypothetical protein
MELRIRFTELLERIHGQLEAQVHLAGPNVKQEVARAGHGAVPICDDLPEGVQLGWAPSTE